MSKSEIPANTPPAIAPTRHSSPHVTEAPGRGIIPNASQHTAAMPLLYQLDAQPMEQVSELLQRQYLTGAHATLVKWTAKKGATVPLHHHANEQITWITAGEAEVYSQGRKYLLKAGDIMIFPPNVPHEFFFTADTIDIDIFSPPRQDWLEGRATYYAK